MEALFNEAQAAVKGMETALERYEQAQEAIAILSAYYSSDDWKNDYAADEAGLLPDDLKRGILSEDAIWNLLSACKELNEREPLNRRK